MEVYLDNNSSTPMDPKVKEVYCNACDVYGNINI
jgi:cysteine desulfurase